MDEPKLEVIVRQVKCGLCLGEPLKCTYSIPETGGFESRLAERKLWIGLYLGGAGSCVGREVRLDSFSRLVFQYP